MPPTIASSSTLNCRKFDDCLLCHTCSFYQSDHFPSINQMVRLRLTFTTLIAYFPGLFPHDPGQAFPAIPHTLAT